MPRHPHSLSLSLSLSHTNTHLFFLRDPENVYHNNSITKNTSGEGGLAWPGRASQQHLGYNYDDSKAREKIHDQYNSKSQ